MGKLKDEIANDPLGRGYASMTDQALLDSLNAVDRPRNRVRMTGLEVKASIDPGEYTLLIPPKKQQVIEWLKRDDLAPFGFDRDVLVDIFGVSTTVSNLDSARVETISRGVELGLGIVRARDLRMHTLSRKHPS